MLLRLAAHAQFSREMMNLAGKNDVDIFILHPVSQCLRFVLLEFREEIILILQENYEPLQISVLQFLILTVLHPNNKHLIYSDGMEWK